MGKNKNKNKTEENTNLGEVTKTEVINAAESGMYDQDKENKNQNLEKQEIKTEESK